MPIVFPAVFLRLSLVFFLEIHLFSPKFSLSSITFSFKMGGGSFFSPRRFPLCYLRSSLGSLPRQAFSPGGSCFSSILSFFCIGGSLWRLVICFFPLIPPWLKLSLFPPAVSAILFIFPVKVMDMVFFGRSAPPNLAFSCFFPLVSGDLIKTFPLSLPTFKS